MAKVIGGGEMMYHGFGSIADFRGIDALFRKRIGRLRPERRFA